MPFGYPVLLELTGRRCVVIGTLPVREGKVEGLLAGGATEVVVVAAEPGDRLDDLEALDGVTVIRRTWYAPDLADAFLVIAHDPDPAVRARIAAAAREAGALVNVVDDIPRCDWAAPAVVRRGELLLAIGTGGASPALAKKIRSRLEAQYGAEWAEVLRVLREVREETLPLLPDLRTRSRRWAEALDPDEAAALVQAGQVEELRSRLLARLLDGADAP
ncbi:MAG: bifunctional precorrin-2 dehydrogenase/sirohydrochlorin ferrochelatase [Actinobacteria bacterium]|nr:MAG: bifunctional precorrin-2 dehydrogenase/sirohydrochlorin ferrochelatase [Actinomycetota bacterium]TMK20098.1 MAG: bifunctional precorrin-2 dehydrogenase/sirohydrochlorin ferrochelatase [Actinomycetota bacterium]